MEDQIEIEEDALREWLEDKDFKGRSRFNESQIEFIIDNIDLLMLNSEAKDFNSFLLFGFNMFQIRYLLKLFNV